MTPSDIEKSNIDSMNCFDEWWSETYLKSFGSAPNSMMLAFREIAYQAWQSSRDSLVVELPNPGYGHMVDFDDVVNSIQSAGINYRERE